MRDDFGGKAMVFVALGVGVRGHVEGPSGRAMTHMRVGNRLIMPLADRARNKLSKPLALLRLEVREQEEQTILRCG
jgi:hypothetical protein